MAILAVLGQGAGCPGHEIFELMGKNKGVCEQKKGPGGSWGSSQGQSANETILPS